MVNAPEGGFHPRVKVFPLSYPAYQDSDRIVIDAFAMTIRASLYASDRHGSCEGSTWPYPLAGRDTTERGMGGKQTPTYVPSQSPFCTNVGGSPRDANMSKRVHGMQVSRNPWMPEGQTACMGSVGVVIVVGGVTPTQGDGNAGSQGEGPQPDGPFGAH
jgi:hypothetical protein